MIGEGWHLEVQKCIRHFTDSQNVQLKIADTFPLFIRDENATLSRPGCLSPKVYSDDKNSSLVHPCPMVNVNLAYIMDDGKTSRPPSLVMGIYWRTPVLTPFLPHTFTDRGKQEDYRAARLRCLFSLSHTNSRQTCSLTASSDVGACL